ncbi:MAG TPA: uracil-DNA glycosylase [Hyphomicrobiales bacterium]|nr:uracil-DNA glycosylase [Hyphomicrobiales bacterium]
MSDTARPPMSMEEAQRLLAWYAEAGVDVALAEEGQDRFAESRRRAVPPPAATPARPPAASLADLARSAEDTAGDARAAAAAAQTLDELRAALERFDGLALKKTATRLAFSSGNPQGRLMLVGEAPGRDEDRLGEPFVGAAGRLLDRMLKAIGLDRTQVYIANIIPWRPPGNRTPTPQETQICLPFIRRQIALADPDVLVFLGGTAAQTLTGAREGIRRLRGRWFDYDTGRRTVRALATLHPAYLLRSPSEKRYAWRDFLALQEALDRKD